MHVLKHFQYNFMYLKASLKPNTLLVKMHPIYLVTLNKQELKVNTHQLDKYFPCLILAQVWSMDLNHQNTVTCDGSFKPSRVYLNTFHQYLTLLEVNSERRQLPKAYTSIHIIEIGIIFFNFTLGKIFLSASKSWSKG